MAAFDAVDGQMEDAPLALDGQSWGPAQATGAPNTPRAGDIPTAWASQSQDGQIEWLELTYEDAIVPQEFIIHETYNPGAVFKISVIKNAEEQPVEADAAEDEPAAGDPAAGDEREIVIWEGVDPTRVGARRGVSRIEVDTKVKSKTFRIYLDSPKVAGWNEIDAVGVSGEGAEDDVQWARKVTASSTFAAIGGGGFAGVGVGGGIPREVGILMDFPAEVREPGIEEVINDQERQMAKLLRQLKAAKAEVQELTAKLDAQATEIAKLKAAK
jgi:hypothetical protein